MAVLVVCGGEDGPDGPARLLVRDEGEFDPLHRPKPAEVGLDLPERHVAGHVLGHDLRRGRRVGRSEA